MQVGDLLLPESFNHHKALNQGSFMNGAEHSPDIADHTRCLPTCSSWFGESPGETSAS